jgi:hypothetical protein
MGIEIPEPEISPDEVANALLETLSHRVDRIWAYERLETIRGSKRLAIVQEYFRQWETGINSEPVEHKRANAGRYRASTFLRNLTESLGPFENSHWMFRE